MSTRYDSDDGVADARASRGELARDLASLDGPAHVVESLDEADAHALVARHLGREIEHALASLPHEQRAEHARELLFVTLDKSGKGFSPTTRYRDYAISPTHFHWETQSTASVTRPSGRRYVESPANGWSFHLFVRTEPRAAFAFLGPVSYESHEGDRPIAIKWRLAHPLPALLHDRYATLRPT